MISVIRFVSGCILLTLLPRASFGQPTYGPCKDPNYRLCYAGDVKDGSRMPTPQTAPMRPITPTAGVSRTSPTAAQPANDPVSAMALQDWRFSHPTPALLVSINFGSSLQSPLWASLLSALGAGGEELKVAAIERARSALGGIGQLLVSISFNGTQNPSALVLAKGNVDSAASTWLISSPGTQFKRIDAVTTLAGDPNSIALASLRMQSRIPQTTFNPLQQAATREALKYDAWIGLDPKQMASFAPSFGREANPVLGIMGSLRGISIGLYLRDQLRIEAVFETQSPDMAARLLAAYQDQAKAASRQGFRAWGSATWMVVEGASLRFTEIVDAGHLKEVAALNPAVAKMIGPQISSLVQGLAQSKPQSAAAVDSKTPQGKILIQGR